MRDVFFMEEVYSVTDHLPIEIVGEYDFYYVLWTFTKLDLTDFKSIDLV